MEIVRGHKMLSRRLRAPVIAIGNFDGVHRGHAQLFSEARKRATDIGGEAVVLTFEPHPAKVLAPAYAPPLITPLGRKLELIGAAGIDVTVVETFDRSLAARSPVEFVDEILIAGLGARQVVIGHDFTFGKGRSGTADSLAELGKKGGFAIHVVPPFTVDGMVCSSTKVREFVLEGRVEGARLLLGRDVEVEGEVARGAGRGRGIGVPTANLRPETELLPRSGVYAGWAEVKGHRWVAAINIGTNPTFAEGSSLTVEAYLLDAEVDLYGARLRLGFRKRLRAEQRFASAAALVEQIARDVAETRACMTGGDG